MIREVTKALSRKDTEGDGFLLVPGGLRRDSDECAGATRGHCRPWTSQTSTVSWTNLIRSADRVTQFVESRVAQGQFNRRRGRPESRARAENSSGPTLRPLADP